VRWRKSDPTLLDHAGDTLYRLGRHDQAAARWRQSVDAARDAKRRSRDREDEAVAHRAEAKLAALKAGKRPDVAKVAPAGSQPASEPAPDRAPTQTRKDERREQG